MRETRFGVFCDLNVKGIVGVPSRPSTLELVPPVRPLTGLGCQMRRVIGTERRGRLCEWLKDEDSRLARPLARSHHKELKALSLSLSHRRRTLDLSTLFCR